MRLWDKLKESRFAPSAEVVIVLAIFALVFIGWKLFGGLK